MRAIFHHLCPNCGGAISDERLQEKLPCSKCLPKKVKEENFRDLIRKVYLELKTSGNLKYYAEFYELEKELEDFERFFESKIGNGLWSAQKTWARRLIKGESFTIIAPTGVGKTTLASVYAVYLTKKERKKVYLVVPTTTLVKQVKERIEEFGGDVIAYYSGMKSKEKEEFLERLKNGDFAILVTTSQFLARKFEDLKKIKFDLIFVDDVDALLKASRNIERVLILLGFSEEDIEKAMYVINLKSKIPYTRDEEKLQEIFEKINRYARYFEKKRKGVGQLILSSATARPRGKKPRLFRELLGFEIGESGGGLRKIVDMYIVSEDIEEKILEVVRKFGTGGLIFVSKDLGEEYAYKLRDFLKEGGIDCDVLVSGEKKDKIEKFREGEIDILIGVAHFYGLLVRGIDLPERVRYVVFYEVPRFKVRLSDALLNPYFLIYILDEMYKITGEKDFDTLSNVIQRFLRESSRGLIQLTLKYLAGEEISLIPRAQEFVDTVLKARLMILEKVKEKETLEKLKNAKNFYFDGEFVYFPDINTYIQASGRCSRLFAGGLTQGASIVVTRNERLLKILERKLSWRISDFEFKRYEEVNLDELIKKINEDRELVRKIQKGEIPPEFEDPIKSILFIVESPNKARTIANFFGRPSVRRKGRLQVYEVTTGKYLIDIVATIGHIFDLVTEEGVHGVLKLDSKWIPVYSTIKVCLDCGNTFTDDYKKCPICGSTNIMDRREIVEALREMAKEVDLVLIATDPDTEGEKIAWDVQNIISPYVDNIKRAEFHEVTERAILNAIEHPRDINYNLVEAQIVRRIEDRWIGFELSQKLWEVFKNKNLSAGRVQTPVLKWIIDRYDERQRDLHYFFTLKTEGFEFEFDLPNVKKEEEAREIVERIKKVKVKLLKEYEREVNPLPPFETQAMISEASRRLKWTASKTMQIAQELFESGLITYHRTDSIRVSPEGIGLARRYISENFGEEYYKGRPWGSGGAHECIRPTRPLDVKRLLEMISEGMYQNIGRDHIALYELIFRRFIASQMVPAKIKYAVLEVEVPEVNVRKEIEVPVEIIEEGWLKVNPVIEVKKVKSGELDVKEKEYRLDSEIFLYTEGSLVQEMKERRIGRPSTYATIISKIKKRRYVRERYYLIPTRRGRKVCKFLFENYRELINEERTRELEEKMDRIEKGEVKYQDVLWELYEELKKYNLLTKR